MYEKLGNMNKRRASSLVMLLGAGTAALAGCSVESPAVVPQTVVTAEGVAHLPQARMVAPGQAVVLMPLQDDTERHALMNAMPLVDHIYPHGMVDDDAPTISGMPARIRANVNLSGRSPALNNDLACDTLNVDTQGMQGKARVRIAALALSGNPDRRAIVAWPETADGQPGNTVELCSPQDDEPDDGVVLAVVSAS